tara:strand:+ start:112 stop:768 length:657 start_codon:yes stop_codon:yes gene_type:complete
MLEQKLKKIVKLTAHTQRNWDLSVPFPQPHTEKIVDFATSACPSKNGINFFDIAIITDLSIRTALYNCTKGYNTDYGKIPNSQILAPLVLVWLNKYRKAETNLDGEAEMTDAYWDDESLLKEKEMTDGIFHLQELTAMHVGLSGGYANIMAGSLGYKTGFCKCFSDRKQMKHILGVDQKVELMLGIGEANETLDHYIHQDGNTEYGTTIREPIKVIKL